MAFCRTFVRQRKFMTQSAFLRWTVFASRDTIFTMSYFYLILLGAIWGASYLLIKIGGESIPTVTFVMGRTGLAAVTLFLIALLRREKLPSWRAPVWRWLWVMGLLNSVIPYTLITWGETRVSSGLAAILVGAMPIFTVLLAHRLTHDEKITPLKALGIAAGFVGVVILFLPDVLEGATFTLMGGAAILLAAASYALATIQARKHLKGYPHATVSLGQMLTASALLIPASLLFDQPWTLQPTTASLVALAFLAVVGTALAYLMYYWLIEHVGATRTSLVTYISPVIAIFLGAAILNESLHWTTFAGLSLIVAGVGLVTRKRAPDAVPLVTAEEM
ncbi:MAG: EamA family transporter [Chloroflexi bacterium]|nr:MAG: EamA family transporter [Chloroflexota bacterium]